VNGLGGGGRGRRDECVWGGGGDSDVRSALFSLLLFIFSVSPPPPFNRPEFIRFAGKIGKQRFFLPP